MDVGIIFQLLNFYTLSMQYLDFYTPINAFVRIFSWYPRFLNVDIVFFNVLIFTQGEARQLNIRNLNVSNP